MITFLRVFCVITSFIWFEPGSHLVYRYYVLTLLIAFKKNTGVLAAVYPEQNQGWVKIVIKKRVSPTPPQNLSASPPYQQNARFLTRKISVRPPGLRTLGTKKHPTYHRPGAPPQNRGVLWGFSPPYFQVFFIGSSTHYSSFHRPLEKLFIWKLPVNPHGNERGRLPLLSGSGDEG